LQGPSLTCHGLSEKKSEAAAGSAGWLPDQIVLDGTAWRQR
jgi:hypothetical protein